MKLSDKQQSAKLAISVICTVRLGDKSLDASISALRLIQRIDGHHELSLHVKEIGALGPDDPIDPTPYTAALGEKITLTIEPSDTIVGSDKSMTFIGLVTRVTLENSVDGVNWIHLEAHSPTRMLDGARHNRIFFNQSDSDTIDSILGEYSVTKGAITATGDTSDQLHQFNETDFEYIQRLATRNGLYAYYTGSEFRVGKASSSTSVELSFMNTLGSFVLDLGTNPLGFDAQLMDFMDKKWVAHAQKSPSIAVSGLIKSSVDASKKVFNADTASTFSYTPSVAQPSHVQKVVQNQSSGAAGGLVTCKGESIDPTVAIGGCVEISGLANVGGMYWLTEVVHEINDSGQYHNRFEGVPLDLAFTPVKNNENRSTHLQFGLVVDNNDPEKMGRIRVQLPWMGDGESMFWCRMARPDAGQDRGYYSFPDVGDEVLVGFENGDADRPVVLGAMYNGKDTPPKAMIDGSEVDPRDGGLDSAKVIRTKSGNEILFIDSAGNEKIVIRQGKAQNSIMFDAASGSISITISSEEDVTIKAKNITLSADESITLKSAQQDIKISAGGNIKADAKANIEAQASADIKLAGNANAKLEAGATCSVKGSASLTVEGGATGTVKAGGPLTIQGMPVKIN